MGSSLKPAAVRIDVRGLRCPLPVLRLRKLVDGLPAGTALEVLASDPVAARDIPAFAAARGWTVEAVNSDENIQGAVVTVRLML